MMNIRKIAKEANVSVASVSRVLNNRPDVSEDTRERIRKVIELHDYKPLTASHRKVNVGIVVCQETHVIEGFVSNLLAGVSRYTQDCDIFATILFWNKGTEASIVDALRERRCSSAIISFPQALYSQLDKLAESDIPTVLVNGDSERPGFLCLGNDSYEGETLAAKHLLALGHKRIGFLSGPMENCPDHINRRKAYIDAMASAGLQPQVSEHKPTERTSEAGFNQCLELLSAIERPTAILASNDEMAYGALRACWESGLSVPGDVSVMGFDDLPLSRFTHPPLSTVRQPVEEIGYAAAKCAALLAKGHGAGLKSETFKTELCVRASTAAPGKGERK